MRLRLSLKRMLFQYPLLSDESGEARKAYNVGTLMFTTSTSRTTFVIDRKGVVRYALTTGLLPLNTPNSPKIYSSVLDANLNFSAHAKFVHKELDKLDAEEKNDEAPTTDVPGTAKAGLGSPVDEV